MVHLKKLFANNALAQSTIRHNPVHRIRNSWKLATKIPSTLQAISTNSEWATVKRGAVNSLKRMPKKTGECRLSADTWLFFPTFFLSFRPATRISAYQAELNNFKFAFISELSLSRLVFGFFTSAAELKTDCNKDVVFRCIFSEIFKRCYGIWNSGIFNNQWRIEIKVIWRNDKDYWGNLHHMFQVWKHKP